VCEEDDIFGLD
jgi:hypothetical protein